VLAFFELLVFFLSAHKKNANANGERRARRSWCERRRLLLLLLFPFTRCLARGNRA
jgi:hypothetical protein